MWRDVKRHYRVRYKDNEGADREFHILAENGFAATVELQTRIGVPKENVIGIDIWQDRVWKKAPL